MSAKEEPDTTAKLSEPTPEQSETREELIIDEIDLLTDHELRIKYDEIHKEWFPNFGIDEFLAIAEDIGELSKYVPSWLLKTNYEQEFDPKVILSYISTQNSDEKVMAKDISVLVKFGIERGNNLEEIAKKSSAEEKHELKRLKMKYKLVSNAKNSKSAVILSRICESVPILTCLYLKNEAQNPIVSFELMETICKNYPRVMMTSAFAYLIPNKEDEFCVFLKKAHLLHQYQFCATFSHESHPCSYFDVENEFICKVYVNTQAAINGSHMEYDVQIKFLIENDLIVEGENEIIVTEGVLQAVKLWEEKERLHELDQKYCDELYDWGYLT